MNIAYIFPLTSAILYTFATVFTKRAILDGAGLLRTFFITNLLAAVVQFIPIIFVGEPRPDFELLKVPIFCGFLYFLGQLALFVSMRIGDVTVQIPMLGIKVVFVAIFLIWLTGVELETKLMVASVITTIAVFIMGMSSVKFSKKMLYTIVLVLIANAAFAFSDCLIQIEMSKVGTVWFMFFMYNTTMLFSFLVIPFFRAPLRAIPKSAWKWTLGGAAIMSIQAFILVFSMGYFKIAAAANIIYATRGIWSIVIIWFAGKFIGNDERSIGANMMLKRLAGASLMLLAVAITIF